MNLVNAEILKLRRRRGLMVWSALLTLGPVLIAYGVLVALHAAAPDRHGPAGGVANLDHVLGLVTTIGIVAGILLGTTAGSQDTSAGVFRDLVVTGRPRKWLFHARTPGALAVFLPLYAAGFAVAVASSFAFAGGLATPDAHRILESAAWAGSLGVVTVVLAVSLGSIVASRIAVGVLVAWTAFAANVLLSIGALGSARAAIPSAAALHFAPTMEDTTRIAMSSHTAIVVLVVWTAVALRAGVMWTQRRDA